MENGLVIEDILEGNGSEAMDFNKVVVNYTGKLEDGSIFDSSLKITVSLRLHKFTINSSPIIFES